MTGPANRRGFLRGLVSLPLIGGGVTLIGQPSAVAAPVTDVLLDRYCAFLATEFQEAMVERRKRRADMTTAAMVARGAATKADAEVWVANCMADYRDSVTIRWAPRLQEAERIALPSAPSTRAALVLSAVGYDWRECGR